MSYKVIQLPFSLRFRDMSKKELKDYAAWFHQISPERIVELAHLIEGTSGYESWQPDASPGSLEPLGRWFDGEVRTRSRTAEEIEELRASLSFPMEIGKEELTNPTFSVAFDIGFYFGQVVLKNIAGTRWDQPLGSKNFVDYGQPVITGFGRVELNPVRIAVSTAYGIARKKPARLLEIYAYWEKLKAKAVS